MCERRVIVVDWPTDGQVAEVERLVEAVTASDGNAPFDEHVLLYLRRGGEKSARNLLLYSGDELAGFAHLEHTGSGAELAAELAVAPAHRERGHGRALAGELLEQAGAGRLRIWSHGNHPAATSLAASMGFTRVRSLWRMRRRLDGALPEPVLPSDVSVRTFVPGRDEQAWVATNARAFAEHPEQGTWTVTQLLLREREPWFDPKGFFLAERGGRLLGFHWTKVHGDLSHPGADVSSGTDASGGNEPVGEVYVIGVDPAGQGLGLGRALTLTGLRYLASRGLDQVMLYTEETNHAAIRLYESLGFSHSGTDAMFQRQPGPPG